VGHNDGSAEGMLVGAEDGSRLGLLDGINERILEGGKTARSKEDCLECLSEL
jgi:hypothetical protein